MFLQNITVALILVMFWYYINMVYVIGFYKWQPPSQTMPRTRCQGRDSMQKLNRGKQQVLTISMATLLLLLYGWLLHVLHQPNMGAPFWHLPQSSTTTHTLQHLAKSLSCLWVLAKSAHPSRFWTNLVALPYPSPVGYQSPPLPSW